MSDTNNGSKKFGRTPSDAVVEIANATLRITGTFAPYLVVIGLLFFGFYHYLNLERSKLDEIQEARLEAERENSLLVRDLKDQILSDTTVISNLQSSNLDLIDKQLSSQQRIITSITENLDLVSTLSTRNRELQNTQTDLEQRLTKLEEREAALQLQARELEILADVAGHIAQLLADDTQSAASGSGTFETLSVAWRFEGRTIDHIGRDQFGTYYYGPYRISSSATFRSFIDFLFYAGPEFSEKLQEAGGAEAASAGQPEFVQTWQQLSTGSGFVEAQSKFIQETMYKPAARECAQRSGLDVDASSLGVRAALASAAVQHGSARAAEICAQAAEISQEDEGFLEAFYQLRRAAMQRMEAISPQIDAIVTKLLEVRYVLEFEEVMTMINRDKAEQ